MVWQPEQVALLKFNLIVFHSAAVAPAGTGAELSQFVGTELTGAEAPLCVNLP
jgi:hypothetical protein